VPVTIDTPFDAATGTAGATGFAGGAPHAGNRRRERTSAAWRG